MPLPVFQLLGQIVVQIRLDGEAEQEPRWYELYDKLFNYLVSRMGVDKNCVTVAPQWSIRREALHRPVNLDAPGLAQEEAEEFLADMSMETNISLAAMEGEPAEDEPKSENPVGSDMRIPDFMLFHINDISRHPMMIVEIKPESPEKPMTTLTNAFDQVCTQAQFLFDRWPTKPPSIWVMVVRGTLFHEYELKREDLGRLPHHHINKNRHLSVELGRKEFFLPCPDLTWRPVFAELSAAEYGRYDPFIRGFSREFKDAMDTIMQSNHMSGIRWEDRQR